MRCTVTPATTTGRNAAAVRTVVANWVRESLLGVGRVDRPDAQVVGPLVARLPGVLLVAVGGPDEKNLGRQVANRADGQVGEAEVDTVGASTQRDVQPVADDHRCPKQAEPVNHHGREANRARSVASFARTLDRSGARSYRGLQQVAQPPRPWRRAGALGSSTSRPPTTGR